MIDALHPSGYALVPTEELRRLQTQLYKQEDLLNRAIASVQPHQMDLRHLQQALVVLSTRPPFELREPAVGLQGAVPRLWPLQLANHPNLPVNHLNHHLLDALTHEEGGRQQQQHPSDHSLPNRGPVRRDPVLDLLREVQMQHQPAALPPLRPDSQNPSSSSSTSQAAAVRLPGSNSADCCPRCGETGSVSTQTTARELVREHRRRSLRQGVDALADVPPLHSFPANTREQPSLPPCGVQSSYGARLRELLVAAAGSWSQQRPPPPALEEPPVALEEPPVALEEPPAAMQALQAAEHLHAQQLLRLHQQQLQLQQQQHAQGQHLGVLELLLLQELLRGLGQQAGSGLQAHWQHGLQQQDQAPLPQQDHQCCITLGLSVGATKVSPDSSPQGPQEEGAADGEVGDEYEEDVDGLGEAEAGLLLLSACPHQPQQDSARQPEELCQQGQGQGQLWGTLPRPPLSLDDGFYVPSPTSAMSAHAPATSRVALEGVPSDNSFGHGGGGVSGRRRPRAKRSREHGRAAAAAGGQLTLDETALLADAAAAAVPRLNHESSKRRPLGTGALTNAGLASVISAVMNPTAEGGSEGDGGSGIGGDCDGRVVLLAKVLTQSDARTRRLILPRSTVEANLPEAVDRFSYSFDTLDEHGQSWLFTVRAWPNGSNPKPVYVLEHISEYVKAYGITAGDVVGLLRDPHGRMHVELNSAAVVAAAAAGGGGTRASRAAPTTMEAPVAAPAAAAAVGTVACASVSLQSSPVLAPPSPQQRRPQPVRSRAANAAVAAGSEEGRSAGAGGCAGGSGAARKRGRARDVSVPGDSEGSAHEEGDSSSSRTPEDATAEAEASGAGAAGGVPERRRAPNKEGPAKLAVNGPTTATQVGPATKWHKVLCWEQAALHQEAAGLTPSTAGGA